MGVDIKNKLDLISLTQECSEILSDVSSMRYFQIQSAFGRKVNDKETQAN